MPGERPYLGRRVPPNNFSHGGYGEFVSGTDVLVIYQSKRIPSHSIIISLPETKNVTRSNSILFFFRSILILERCGTVLYRVIPVLLLGSKTSQELCPQNQKFHKINCFTHKLLSESESSLLLFKNKKNHDHVWKFLHLGRLLG